MEGVVDLGGNSTLDVDGDGTVDVVHALDEAGANVDVYLDAQGEVLLVESDEDGDGKLDTVTYGGQAGTVIQEIDADGNGGVDLRAVYTADGRTVQVDEIEDGRVVASTYDIDGDGRPDVTVADLDRDGRLETQILDVDGDGIADTVLTDHDGDGLPDSVTFVYGGPDGAAVDPSPADESAIPYELGEVDPGVGAVDELGAADL